MSQSLQVVNAALVHYETARDTVGQLVKHHIVIEVSVSVGRWPIEDIHLHLGRSSVSRRREIRIVERGRVLGLGLHGITAQSAAPEIVVLKVSRRLGET